MTFTLSPAQSAQYAEGGWLAFEVEETVLEDLERQHITGTVVVCTIDQQFVFLVTPARETMRDGTADQAPRCNGPQ